MHAAGTFCWTELMTTNVGKAKPFYKAVLGWDYKEVPMPGGSGTYTMPQVGGKDAGGFSDLDPNLAKNGVPPHWGLYVAVTDVDATFKKAGELGGKGLMQPFDIPNIGRMAVLQDPTGATISLWWQKGNHSGFGTDAAKNSADANGGFCWGELMTSNIDKAQSFYSKLFGWKTKGSPDYVEWEINGQAIGGMMPIPQGQKMPSVWMPYFAVANADKAIDAAKKNGGKVLMGPMDMDNVGRFAAVQDPQGAAFNVIKLSRNLGKHIAEKAEKSSKAAKSEPAKKKK